MPQEKNLPESGNQSISQSPVPANIIFDLGGVIMNIDFRRTEKAFHDLGLTNFSNHINQLHITPFFTDYEIGKIDDAGFIKGIQQVAGVSLTEEQVINAWNALLLDFPPERIALLKKLKTKYRLFLLSNTNSLHYTAFQQRFKALTGGYLEELFEKTYYSHTAGMRKPGKEIYQLVIDENKLDPAETVFIDDTASNLTGAQEAGLQTIHLAAPMTILDLGL